MFIYVYVYFKCLIKIYYLKMFFKNVRCLKILDKYFIVYSKMGGF